jgi:hypothetical protein
VVRRQPLPGLSLFARPLGRDGRGLGGEYVHKRIRGELGFAAEEARDREAMLAQGCRGSRYSFGYPACPNLADQQQLLALLRAEEIGITLSEEDQLDPNNPPPRSSSTTRRRSTSRCEAGVFPCRRENAGRSHCRRGRTSRTQFLTAPSAPVRRLCAAAPSESSVGEP